MSAEQWVVAAVGAAGLLGTAAGVVFSHGRASERIAQLDRRIEEHGVTIDAVARASQGANSAVDLLAQKIESLGQRWAAEQKVAAVELGRVADSIKSGHDLIAARLDGMETFSRAELEHVRRDLRGVTLAVGALEQGPSAKGRARAV
jgi:hypothetical protein